MAKLYNWRYEALGDLPNVIQQERFRKANAGLAYDYQFIGKTLKLGQLLTQTVAADYW